MMMRRKYLLIAVALALLLAGADAAYWRFVAERLRTGYQDWVAAQTAQGWTIASGATRITGWPRAAILEVPNLTLRHAGPKLPGDLSIAFTGVAVSVSLLQPASLQIAMIGPAHARVADAPEMVLSAEESAIVLPLLKGGSQVIDLRAKSLRVEPATGSWHSTIGTLSAHATLVDETKGEQSEPAATFSVSAEAIALPGVVKWPLGTNISSLSLDGVLNGPLPNTQDITQGAEAWRDGGGSLAISHFVMGWGLLGLSSSATLALDDQLQPMGSGSGHIVGYAATLDRLAAAGMLTKSAATAAKAVLSLMAGTTDSEEASAVDVPLTLQYRTLSMRQVPLLRLPELDWPAR